MNRRRLLTTCGASILLGTSGCVDESDSGMNEQEGFDAEQSDHGRGIQFAVSSTAEWWSDETDTTGHVELYGSADAAFAGLDLDKVTDSRREAVESFVEETVFVGVAEKNPSALLFLESVGPNTGFREIEVEELSKDGAITGTARAKQVADGGDDEITFPSMLIRTRRSSPATMTIRDGRGDEETLEASLRS